MNSLQIPPAACDDPNSFEIARIWAARGKQHVIFNSEIWEEPECWGIMLADLALHVVNAYKQLKRANPEETLRLIRQGFEAELASPTGEPEGSVVDK